MIKVLNEQFDKDEYLQNLSTKELLSLLQSARACGGSYCLSSNDSTDFTTDEIKSELLTREHVPNKPEAKAIRQQKARGNF